MQTPAIIKKRTQPVKMNFNGKSWTMANIFDGRKSEGGGGFLLGEE